MQTYDGFPPVPYLINVLKSNSSLAWLYIQLWLCKDENDIVLCPKEDVRRLFLMSPTLFRNQMMHLVDLGLLSCKQRRDQYYEIAMVDLDQEEFDRIEYN